MHAIMGVNMTQGYRDCSCAQLRRARRRAPQLYDQTLEPAGLTIGQFGILAHLAAIGGPNTAGIAISALADERGMDTTTLTRTLKPLIAKGWIAETRDRDDRRVRALVLSPSGRKKYLAA